MASKPQKDEPLYGIRVSADHAMFHLRELFSAIEAIAGGDYGDTIKQLAYLGLLRGR